MTFKQIALPFTLLLINLLGCDSKTVIPDAPFTEEQKKAIQADDARVADEESHGMNKKKK